MPSRESEFITLQIKNVPRAFKRRLKAYADEHEMEYAELLQKSFDALVAAGKNKKA
jgi:hypothetical protein